MRPATIHTGAWRYPGAFADAHGASAKDLEGLAGRARSDAGPDDSQEILSEIRE